MSLQQENAILRKTLKDIAENLPLDILKYKAKRDSMLGIILGNTEAIRCLPMLEQMTSLAENMNAALDRAFSVVDIFGITNASSASLSAPPANLAHEEYPPIIQIIEQDEHYADTLPGTPPPTFAKKVKRKRRYTTYVEKSAPMIPQTNEPAAKKPKVAPRLKCSNCDRDYANMNTLSTHFRKVHSNNG